MTTLAVRANEFLAQRRIALVGVSRDPRDMSRTLFRELRQRGYDVVPVHPTLDAVDGVACARRLQDVSPSVAGALLMTPPRRPRVWYATAKKPASRVCGCIVARGKAP